MSSIRIYVQDGVLGDVEVVHDDHLTSFGVASQREAITRLLERATDQIRAAYGLGDPTTKETTP